MPAATSNPELPNEHAVMLARESLRRLAPLLRDDRSVLLSVSAAGIDAADDAADDGTGGRVGDGAADRAGPVTVELPREAATLLLRLLDELAQGNAVAVLPVHAELTTQQAADMLGMSRAYFVRLLDAGKLAFTRTGTHRRVRLQDLMAFKKSRDAARLQSIDQMVAIAQEHGMEH